MRAKFRVVERPTEDPEPSSDAHGFPDEEPPTRPDRRKTVRCPACSFALPLTVVRELRGGARNACGACGCILLLDSDGTLLPARA